MKKIYFLTIVLATCACTLFCYSLKNVNNMNEFFSSSPETMAQNEWGPTVYCYCARTSFLTNKECRSSNTGALCAQSEPGGNIDCGEYNSNCGKDN